MSDETGITDRLRLGEHLRGLRDGLASALTEGYFRDHPEFEAAHPPLARQRTREDFAFLIDFLAAAVEAASTESFVDMVRWTARVLEARRVPRSVLADSLSRLEAGVADRVADRDRASILVVLGAGLEALEGPVAVAGEGREGRLSLASRVYHQAVLQGDRRAALTVALETLRDGASAADVYLEVLQEAMYEVGRRWEANEITVADEHLATAITQWVLAQLYLHLEIPEPHRGRVVITGIEGELHQVGANMVADMLEADGWNVRFLGANVPPEAVLRAVEEHGADVLGISTTMLYHLPKVERLVRDSRGRFGGDLRIVLGGAAFRFKPEVAREVGADAYARDLRGAVAAFRGETGAAS